MPGGWAGSERRAEQDEWKVWQSARLHRSISLLASATQSLPRTRSKLQPSWASGGKGTAHRWLRHATGCPSPPRATFVSKTHRRPRCSSVQKRQRVLEAAAPRRSPSRRYAPRHASLSQRKPRACPRRRGLLGRRRQRLPRQPGWSAPRAGPARSTRSLPAGDARRPRPLKPRPSPVAMDSAQATPSHFQRPTPTAAATSRRFPREWTGRFRRAAPERSRGRAPKMRRPARRWRRSPSREERLPLSLGQQRHGCRRRAGRRGRGFPREGRGFPQEGRGLPRRCSGPPPVPRRGVAARGEEAGAGIGLLPRFQLDTGDFLPWVGRRKSSVLIPAAERTGFQKNSGPAPAEIPTAS